MSFKSIFQELAEVFSGLYNKEIKPWLSDLGHKVSHDAMEAAVPLLHESVQDVLNVGEQILHGTAVSEALPKLLPALVATAKKLEASEISVTLQDVLAAGAAVIANRNPTPTTAP